MIVQTSCDHSFSWWERGWGALSGLLRLLSRVKLRTLRPEQLMALTGVHVREPQLDEGGKKKKENVFKGYFVVSLKRHTEIVLLSPQVLQLYNSSL